MLRRDGDRCSLCRLCEMECGTFAINIVGDEMEYVPDVCDMCGGCVSICEDEALSLRPDA